MNTNTLRRLNWLWKHRHTHDDDNVAEQLIIITGEIQQQVDSVGSATNGAYIHLARAATQSIAADGEPIDFDQLGALGYAGFSSPGIADDGTTGGGMPTPGTDIVIPLAGYWDVKLAAGWDSHTAGGSVWITRTRGGVESTIYPPAGMPDGLWTADDGQVGEWIAKGIPCEVGDILKVYIDADESTAQDLASAVVVVELVDRASTVRDYPSLILSHGPIAYWRLGELTGTEAADYTGNGHTGNYVASPTLGAGGLLSNGDPDRSVDLDGSTQWVEVDSLVASLVGVGAVTIEAWIHLPVLVDTTILAINTSSGGNWYVFGTATGGAVSWTEGSSSTDVSSVVLTAGTIHHVVATRAAGTPGDLKFYVDGVEVYSNTAPGNIAAGTETAQIGMDYDGATPSDLLDGRIDEVAVWDRVLTAEEILEHYQVGSGT